MLVGEMARCAALYFRQPTSRPQSLLGPDELNHYFSQLLALVFLKEMPRITDLHVLAIPRARNTFLKRPLGAARYGIAVAKGCQKWLIPL